jgi:Flp pilus assembly protein TadD
MLRARFEMNRENLEDAARIVDDLLAGAPADIKALSFKAALLEAAGKFYEAWDAARQAVAAYEKANPGAKELPEELYGQRANLLRRLAGDVPQ